MKSYKVRQCCWICANHVSHFHAPHYTCMVREIEVNPLGLGESAGASCPKFRLNMSLAVDYA